jgi:DNA-binding SARP family transcriptional activator
MSIDQLVARDFEAFMRHTQGKQIVLLHPESRLRSMIVAYLLTNAPKPVFYYAMGANDINLAAFLDGFSHDISVQQPTFGRHLLQSWNKKTNMSPHVLVDDFVADLGELSAEPYILIIDEFDATDNAEGVQGFLELALHRLPPQCQIIINSRTEPRFPWVAMMARNQAVVLRDADLVRENFYRKNTISDPQVYLKTIGFSPGIVHLPDGRVGEWEGHLPRLLYFFILDRPLVTRAEICATFWEDLSIDQAVNVFHVTKRRLHKALGFDVLVHLDGYYQINPEIFIDYDVERFTTALIRAREADSLRDGLPFWQEAVDNYGGPFLQGHNEDWITNRRESFLAGYLEAMQAIAQVRLDENRPEAALSLLNRATNESELNESLHRKIMQLYIELGRRSEAAGHYQKLISTLESEKRRPEGETLEMFDLIMES